MFAIFLGFVFRVILYPCTLKLDGKGFFSKTVFHIKNLESVDGAGCTATLNSKFSTEVFALHAGDELSIEFPQFSAADGERFNFIRYATKSIHLVCGPLGDRRYIDFAIEGLIPSEPYSSG